MEEVETNTEVETIDNGATANDGAVIIEDNGAVMESVPLSSGDTEALMLIPDPTSSTDKLLLTIGESSIYMMGLSFILGSLFTIMVLLLLDFMRRNQTK